MRDPLKSRFALAARVGPRFDHDHCSDKLQAILDPVCQLLQQHADTLVRGRMLTLKPCTLGDVFDRQEDLLYLVASLVNLARVEHHYSPSDRRRKMLGLKVLD